MFIMPFAQVLGKKIFYQIITPENCSGSNFMIVFLHEGLGSIPQWKDFPAELSAKTGIPALLYDRYGYGQSEGLSEKRNAGFLDAEAGAFLPALLEQLGISRNIILFGHSDGATIALMYASLFPDRVSAVISEAAHVFLEEISLEGIRKTMKLFRCSGLRDMLGKYHGEKIDSMFYGWAETWLSDDMKGWQMIRALEKIQAPLLAIQGDDDEYGTKAQLDMIVEHTGGPSEMLMIPSCGHIPHLQSRAEVTHAVVRFINNIVQINS